MSKEKRQIGGATFVWHEPHEGIHSTLDVPGHWSMDQSYEASPNMTLVHIQVFPPIRESDGWRAVDFFAKIDLIGDKAMVCGWVEDRLSYYGEMIRATGCTPVWE